MQRGADLHVAQLMPLPLTVSCFSKIQIGFTFLVPAHPGSRGKRAVKQACVCSILGWLGSRVVSVLDSGAEWPGFNSVTTLSGNSLRQIVHSHCASVHQAAKLVTALLRVAGVTAGLAESNGSLLSGLWFTAKNRDQLRNPMLRNRVWATFFRIPACDIQTNNVGATPETCCSM